MSCPAGVDIHRPLFHCDKVLFQNASRAQVPLESSSFSGCRIQSGSAIRTDTGSLDAAGAGRTIIHLAVLNHIRI